MPETTMLPVVFLLDCDNTLLDNDAVKADMDAGLTRVLGEGGAQHFWAVYEQVRSEFGQVDLPLTFDWFTQRHEDTERGKRVTSVIMDFPFAKYVFPGTPAALAHMHSLGQPVIVSDGDTTFQPRKLAESGLAPAVHWQAVIYRDKAQQIEEIMRRWPARFYVIVDDKARILTACKSAYPNRFVTVHVRKGHYAAEAPGIAPDFSLGAIEEITALGLGDFEQLLHQ